MRFGKAREMGAGIRYTLKKPQEAFVGEQRNCPARADVSREGLIYRVSTRENAEIRAVFSTGETNENVHAVKKRHRCRRPGGQGEVKGWDELGHARPRPPPTMLGGNKWKGGERARRWV